MNQNETVPFSKRSKMYDLEPINKESNAIKTCSGPSSCFLVITSKIKSSPRLPSPEYNKVNY